jgi:glycerophosphoryl diester phosphodiesterase
MTKKLLLIVAERWRQLLGFALLFRVVESLLFAPLVAVAGHWLLGRTVLDSTAIVSFLLSPRGLVAIVLASVTAITIRLMEHAGLSAVFFGACESRTITAREALRLVRLHLLKLVRVCARFTVIGLIVLLPLLAVSGGFARWLLSGHDINYYLKLKPPEFFVAVISIGVVALATAVCLLWLVVRWRWVVQVILFEQKQPREAFARSAVLTQGIRWRLTGLLMAVMLASLALGLIAAVAADAATSLLLGVIPPGTASLAISFGLLLLFRILVGVACTFLASCVDAGAFTLAYRQRLASVGGQAALPILSRSGSLDAAVRWAPAALTGLLLALAATASWLALNSIRDERTISIHAHRGVSINAPENSLAAARAAIDAGADYIETDVQLSKDGVLVIVHDSDFSRLGGVARKVWDLTYDEIRAIPIGGRSAPEFRGEITPTLDALLTEARGRIKLNIELKYYGDHQPALAQKVIDAVRRHEMLDQVVIQCLEYEPLLEVRRLAPNVPIGYLLSFNALEPSRLDVNFLNVEQSRLDHRFIRRAHRRGQQVFAWTVDAPGDMERLFDLGVDGVITDQSALARATLNKYSDRPAAERALHRVKSWLMD